MQPASSTDPVGVITEMPRARVLLKPLRQRILAEARTPASASAIAAALGLSRQRVNYHVRQLARAGFLRRAGRQRRRGLVEQKYVLSAQAFVLAPDVLGELAPHIEERADTLTAAYLLALAGRMQQEVGRGWREAQAQGTRLPVLSLDTEVRFENAAARARFAQALTEALTRVVAEHTAPPAAAGTATATRPYRLALACYPIPA